ncbi:MAG: ATP-binding cassette domain-containing protein [Pseudomonadota bacterium]
MASVVFERIEKIYPNGFHALKGLDLSIGDGELLVLVGPSGCGKSTLLRVLAGLEAPSAGVVRIGEEAVNERSPQERNIAMVFQDYALYPYLTVRGNLEFPLRMRKLPKAEMRRRIEWVAGMLDLGEVLERLPRQLSGGQRQRVAMGRALVREPRVFLLDEPLSNLDARLRVQVRAEIGELQRKMGTTMLYVTHDQTEAMTLGERVAVLDRGVLQQIAPPDELYSDPANTFVAGFIGNPPMNLFPVRLVQSEAGLGLWVGGQTVPFPDGRYLADRLAAWVGRELTAGARPERFVEVPDGDPHGFWVTVGALEFLGHETLLHAHLDADAALRSEHVVVRLPGRQERPRGAHVRLALLGEGLHLFDENGKAIEAS